MDDLLLDQAYVMGISNDLITFISSIIIKREDLASKYETLNTLKNYDLYLSAYTKTDRFETYETFDEQVLIDAGLTTEEVALALQFKMNIPSDKRDAVVLLQRAKILDEYIESNNYYRMLYGLPANEDYLNIYIEDTIVGVNTTLPVHSMSSSEIDILSALGYIDKLIVQYPTRPYLRYLGDNKINFIIARTAKRFEIIQSGEMSNIFIKNRFNINYELSRAYILNNYYKKRFSIDQTYFDAYIGFIILINSIVMTINESLDIFNKKEYFNEVMVKEILQSHNLNIFDDIPLSYRRKIVDNIESLIVSKGTDEVLFKIFKIFGFDDISVKKFLLIKQHKKDINGKYIFSYEADLVTPKYNEMFDIEFAQVDIKSTNIDAEIRKPENKLVYTDITNNDIYWGGYETDEAIRQKLLKENFNYINTDYINIDIAYALSSLSFEVTYFFSMCLALKDSFKKLLLIEPIFGQEISLFYSITMLTALLSKKSGFTGNIITNPEDIAVIYKFNFDRSLTEINNIMKKYGYTSSSNYAPLLPTSEYTKTSDLVDLYFRNKEIYDLLVKVKTSTRNYKEYLAIRNLLEYTMHSKLSSNVYKKSDGSIATTYINYLYDENILIANYIETIAISDIDSAVLKILTALEDYIQTDRFQYLFLNISSSSGSDVFMKYILKILSVFKAFTINIFSMTTTYNIDSYLNNIKIIDKNYTEGNVFSHNNITLTDTLQVSTTLTSEERFLINDKLEIIDSLEYL